MAAATATILLTCLIAVTCIWLLLRSARGGLRGRLPPGPSTIPILGNLLQLPRRQGHLAFTKWAKECRSDIITIMMAHQPMVILSSAHAVKEVLDKQSGKTSDRPSLHLNMIVTGDYDIALARYTEKWRRIRKAEHLLLSTTTVQKYIPIQEAESTQLLYDFVTAPKKFFHHIERYAASTVLSITYGKRSVRYESSVAGTFAKDFERWLTLLDNHPPMDLFPFLQKVPEFLASWKTEAREIRKSQRGLFMQLLGECEERVASGEDTPFYMADILRSKESLGLEREQLAYLGGDLFGAGADTTSTVLQTFVWLMVKYPAVQRRAQEEIDRVVGRFPTQEDARDLPYLQAIIQELHRFCALLPLAAPHAACDDAEYNGYIIPKGTTILANIYAIFHDEDFFDEPEAFKPERFLSTPFGTKPGVDDSDFRSTLMFGGGRRICPGMHLASNTVVIAAMRLLWAFSFEPAKNAAGEEIPLDRAHWKTAFVEGPLSFDCDIRPRSADRTKILKQAFRVDAAPTLKTFEYRLDEQDQTWLKQAREDCSS
ncbi:cytochrome P450 [Schizophyllum fasciatum]